MAPGISTLTYLLTYFCQSLIIVYVVLHTDRYSCVTLTVGLRQLTGEATRRCGRAPDSSLSTSLLLTADVLKRAVSSFWLCEVRHFPGVAIKKVIIFRSCKFSAPATVSLSRDSTVALFCDSVDRALSFFEEVASATTERRTR